MKLKYSLIPTFGFSAFALLATLHAPTAFAQGDKTGGGGNVTESDLRAYMAKIDRYLQSEEGLKTFPEVAEYNRLNPNETFHDLILKTRPVVREEEVKDQFGNIRDCVSYIGENRYFACHSKRLPSNDLNNQPSLYRIVLHELFVQAGIEKPESSDVPSVYDVSYRITENVHLETYEEWVPGKEKGEAPVAGETILQCKGVWQEQNGDWSLKRRKDFMITVFDNNDTYVTEAIYPIGRENSRTMVGGVKGHRKFRYSGIDKLSHFFAGYNRYSKVRIVKMEKGVSLQNFRNQESNEYLYQPVEVFGETKYLAESANHRHTGVYALKNFIQRIGGINLECRTREPEEGINDQEKIAIYHQYFEASSKEGWQRYSDKIFMADASVMNIFSTPAAPHKTGSGLE